MTKTILITGSTDGIGKATALMLAELGQRIIIHGRSQNKVDQTIRTIKKDYPNIDIDGFVADLSDMKQVKSLAEEVANRYDKIDVLINNAGIFVTDNTLTVDNLELRFAVNTIAPYLLTKLLLPLMDQEGRVINLSSAAQSSVDLEALRSHKRMSNDAAYAQSKLALTMWTFQMAESNIENKPLFIAINPKSFLGSKMVRIAYRTEGHDLRIGADILTRASLSDEFANASGKYFDNDRGQFSNPHPDVLDLNKCDSLVDCLDEILVSLN